MTDETLTPLHEQGPVQQIVHKWKALLEHPDLPPITDVHGRPDAHRKALTAMMLENTAKAMQEDNRIMGNHDFLTEGPSTNNISGGNIALFDPILISLIRRQLPNLMAYEVAGVQPMTGPTGLIFAMRSRYQNQTGSEAFFNEANTDFTGFTSANTFGNVAADQSNNPVANVADSTVFNTGKGMPTGFLESLGDATGSNAWPEMAFSVEKVTVTAQGRALKAEYTMELAQDLKAIHGLDAETELSNILSTELLTEINRELIRKIYYAAVVGAQYGTTTPGYFNLDTDSNGRWMVERFKGLLFHLDREANAIAKATRRGKGNVMIVSSDVASAMAATGELSYTPNLSAGLQVDDTGNTYAGVLRGKYKVFIDPYFGGMSAGQDLVTIGYKGASPYDAGMFYCPYVPLQMVRAIDPNTFQPKLGFKTRYGLVNNPFAEGLNQGFGVINARTNQYYRIMGVVNLM